MVGRKWEKCEFHMTEVVKSTEFSQTKGYPFRQELAIWPHASFYKNGIVLAKLSHNHGYSDTMEFCPFDVYDYDETSDTYHKIWSVDGWEKRLRETDYDGIDFPKDIDLDGDGMVYRIRNEATGELLLKDKAEYESWLEELTKDSEEMKIAWSEIPYVLKILIRTIEVLKCIYLYWIFLCKCFRIKLSYKCIAWNDIKHKKTWID